MAQQIILASTSPFRRALLEKLHLDFECDSPNIDESHLNNETPVELVKRLAEAKARACKEKHPQALIIGSDQVSVLDGNILGKPGNRERAIEQLTNSSGRVVIFYTGLCLYNATTDNAEVICEPFEVHFRELTQAQIEHYLNVEEPYNCAGSFKSEAYGITLFSKLVGEDPNTLIGLPLIKLTALLEQQNIAVV